MTSGKLSRFSGKKFPNSQKESSQIPKSSQIIPNIHKYSPIFPNIPKSSQIRSQSRFFISEVEAESPNTLRKIIFKRVRVVQRRVTSKYLCFAAKCRFRNFPKFLKFSEKSPKFPNCKILSPDLLSLPLHVLALRLAAGTSRTMVSVGNGLGNDLQRQRRSLTGRLRRSCSVLFYHRISKT